MQAQPITDVPITNVAFTATRPTYFEPRGDPSCGDWALERQAALLVEGAEDVLVADALFSRIDGNALMLSGYTRGVVVRDSEFALLGGWLVCHQALDEHAAKGDAGVSLPVEIAHACLCAQQLHRG